MNLLPLQAIPNQDFSTILTGVRYDFRVAETRGVMSITVKRDEVVVVDNMRLTAGSLILPYLYQEQGNFMMLNLNDDLIYYDKFGTTQNLFYLSPDDLANLRSE